MNRLIFIVVAGAAVASCGGSSSTSNAAATTRTIEVTMQGMAFSPATITADRGETVEFKFVNRDSVEHEAIIGDEATQNEHEKSMSSSASSSTTADMGGMSGMSGMSGSSSTSMGSMNNGSDAVTVAPGATKTLTYTFKSSGGVIIGCHEPGHYASGMKALVLVG